MSRKPSRNRRRRAVCEQYRRNALDAPIHRVRSAVDEMRHAPPLVFPSVSADGYSIRFLSADEAAPMLGVMLDPPGAGNPACIAPLTSFVPWVVE